MISMPRPPRISSLLPCFFFDGGAPKASFCSPCPARLGFFLFFPVFSLAAGHHRLLFALHAPPASDFLSSSLFFLWRRGTTGFLLISMPRPPRISSLLPCFFFDGGAPKASFCSPCPARLGFFLFFPVFSLAAGHHRLLFALHAPPASDFLSSSLFFLCRRGTTGFLLISMPRPARIFSLLPCFFSAGGAPQLFFFSNAPPGTPCNPTCSPILTKTATAKPFCGFPLPRLPHACQIIQAEHRIKIKSFIDCLLKTRHGDLYLSLTLDLFYHLYVFIGGYRIQKSAHSFPC